MSIELHRIERIKKKRKKRSRRFMIGMFIISILSVTVSALIAWSIYDGYKKTHKWDKQAIAGTYAQMTPEFAKNHISADMIDDINSLSKVTAMLDSVKENNGLKDINQAKSTLSNSEKILEKHKIISGEAYDKQEELRLYIEIYDLEQTAYETLDSIKLSQTMTALSSKLVEKNASHDKAIMNRLNQIATDYNTLNSFVNTYVPVLGTIGNGLVTVKSDVTQATTDEIINSINENKLEKFQNIKTLKELLQSSKWEKIIKNNTTISEENKWKGLYQVFDSLTKSLYIKESDVTTYADAMNLGLYSCTIRLSATNSTSSAERPRSGVMPPLCEKTHLSQKEGIDCSFFRMYSSSMPLRSAARRMNSLSYNLMPNLRESISPSRWPPLPYSRAMAMTTGRCPAGAVGVAGCGVSKIHRSRHP